ncbi:MAG: leucine-rich repeat domain-containing protein [Treponema sp.]|nr:leucine-rich repeat domain-containing protein [Treponema sp.]
MKKLINLLVIVFVVVIMVSLTACPPGKGDDDDGGQLAFELINGNTAYRVKKGTVKSGVVNIPAQHSSARSSAGAPDSLPVLEVGAPTDDEVTGAFYNTQITAVTIPEGVTSIYAVGFAYCPELTSVTLPESLEFMGWMAFALTPKLQSIIIPGNTKFDDGSGNHSGHFLESGIKSLILSEGITELSDLIFRSCHYLTDVTLPSTLKIINDHAFSGCGRLTNITLPEGLETIGEFAFAGLYGHYSGDNYNISAPLDSITIPASVTSVGRGAFWDGRPDWLNPKRLTIYIDGHANQESADAAWGEEWRLHSDATIIYRGQ